MLSNEDATRFPRRGQTMVAAGDIVDLLCLCVSGLVSMTRTCTACTYDLQSTQKHSLVWVATSDMLEGACERNSHLPSAAMSFSTQQQCDNCQGTSVQTVHSDFTSVPPLLVIELPLNENGHYPVQLPTIDLEAALPCADTVVTA